MHSSPTARSRVTVVGAGAMGSAIAGALLDAGHPVTIWNRTLERAQPLATRGADVVTSLAGAINASDLVIVTVIDHDAVGRIVDAAGRALAGRTVANLTTTTPDEARATAARVAAADGTYLDGVMMAVPALIGTPAAMILFGGSGDEYRRHETTFRTIAGNSSLLGDDPGLPAIYDVALLTLLYSTLAGWLDAFAVAGNGGVAAGDLLPYAQSWFRDVVLAEDQSVVAADVDRVDFPDRVPSPVALNASALAMIETVHRESGADPGLVAAIRRLADQRVAEGHGADGFTSLVEAIRQPVASAEVSA